MSNFPYFNFSLPQESAKLINQLKRKHLWHFRVNVPSIIYLLTQIKFQLYINIYVVMNINVIVIHTCTRLRSTNHIKLEHVYKLRNSLWKISYVEFWIFKFFKSSLRKHSSWIFCDHRVYSVFSFREMKVVLFTYDMRTTAK